MIMVLDPRLNF